MSESWDSAQIWVRETMGWELLVFFSVFTIFLALIPKAQSHRRSDLSNIDANTDRLNYLEKLKATFEGSRLRLALLVATSSALAHPVMEHWWRAPSGVAGSDYEGVIALILTALTGFSVFFFSRARDEISAAQKELRNQQDAFENRIGLNERVDFNRRRLEVDLLRVEVHQSLTEEIQSCRDSIDAKGKLNQDYSRERRRQQAAETLRKEIIKFAPKARGADPKKQHLNSLETLLQNLHDAAEDKDLEETIGEIGSTGPLARWMDLIGDEFHDHPELRTLSRELGRRFFPSTN